MFQILKRNPLAALIAVLMHVAIIVFMIVGVDWLEKPKQPKSNVQVVQARVIDMKVVEREAAKLKEADAKRKKEEDAKRKREEERVADLKRKQEKEKKRLADLEKKRKETEKQKKAAQQQKKALAAKKKREEEAKRKADLEKKKKAEEKKRREAEAKKRKEVEAKRKREAEAKRKAAEEKKRKEREVAAKREAEAARKAREAELQAAAEAEQSAREIDKYTTLINQKVVRSWLRPAGISENLACRLRVRLAKGGNVIAVSVLESSGNGAFDRSATAAVYKAEPLPVPEGRLFEQFRDINFVFDPAD